MQIAISATFTAEPVEEFVTFFGAQLWPNLEVRFAPFNQVFQELLQPGLLRSNRDGFNAIFFRLEDWGPRTDQTPDTLESHFTRVLQEFSAALKHAAVNSKAPLLVFHCPPSEEVLKNGTMVRLLDQADAVLTADHAQGSGVHYTARTDLLSRYSLTNGYYDLQGDKVASIPYTPEFFGALGVALVRRINCLSQRPYKVIAVDCDNTLWGGVIGEDGLTGIQFLPQHLTLQKFLVEQQQAGMLICLTSKNADGDVINVFKNHPSMVLKLDHVVSRRINWQPKSRSLQELSAELGLALDSFIFLDDNPLECAEIQRVCPSVLVLQVPQEPQAVEPFLANMWGFDRPRVTDEDRRRTASYAEEARRKQFREEVSTFSDYLEKLELQIEMAPPDPEHFSRASQLTKRTTQFNPFGKTLTEVQLASILRSEHEGCRVVHVRDRFGDYGLVGVLQYEYVGDAVHAPVFLLSCRALGKGVEHAMLRELAKIGQGAGKTFVVIPFAPTDRNAPALQFLGALCAPSADGMYAFPIEVALNCRLAANASQTPFVEGTAPLTKGLGESAPFPARSDILLDFALHLRDAASIVSRTRASRASASRSPAEIEAAPRTPDEKLVDGIFEEVTGARVAVTDPFTAFNVTSLRMAQITAKITERTGVKVPFAQLLGTTTLAEIAAIVSNARTETRFPRQPLTRTTATEVPATAGQFAYAFASTIDPDSRADYERLDIVFEGPLNIQALGEAIRQIVIRHQVLRTRLVFGDKGFLLATDPAPTGATLERLPPDLSQGPQTAQTAVEMMNRYELDFSLNLEEGPVCRFLLLPLPGGRHLLRWLVHHAVCDGWSFSVFMHELRDLYRLCASDDGISPTLPELPIQYRDYAAWEAAWRSGPELAHHLDFWKKHLAQVSNGSELPQGSEKSHLSLTRDLLLDASACGALETMAAAHRMTLSGLFLTLLYVVLPRYAGAKDLTVGVLNANRESHHLFDLIGCFADVVPVRTRLADTMSLTSAFVQVRNAMKASFDHSDVPLSDILRVCKLKPFGAGGLMQAYFNFQEKAPTDFEVDGVSVSVLPQASMLSAPGPGPLYLNAMKAGRSVKLTFSGNAPKESASLIEDVMRSYSDLCAALTRAPKLSDLPYSRILSDGATG